MAIREGGFSKQMEETNIKGEEVIMYTVDEFISATRPDGLGHIYVDGVDCGGMSEVLCDCCNANILQPEEKPDALLVFSIPGAAWCTECFERWVAE